MDSENKILSWRNYQKNIADDHYFFVRSWSRQTFFPGSEKAFLTIMRDVLGKGCVEDPRHTSCTGIAYHSDLIPIQTIMTVVARHFALMTEAGYTNFLVSCVTSFGIYNEILHMWGEHHPDDPGANPGTPLGKPSRREF